MYEKFCTKISELLSKEVGTGQFGADMEVELLNDGPVTILIDSQRRE
jgi:D-tyrosyl-tRNA(Tyr) deacylase